MPLKFKFTGKDPEGFVVKHFEAPLVHHRCRAHDVNGARCERQTSLGLDYCWQHLQLQHLKIKKEKNYGLGVIAENPRRGKAALLFKKNQPIIEYNGSPISPETLKHRYGGFTAPYALAGFESQVYDPKTKRVRKVKLKAQDAATHRGIGAMLNHAKGKKANAFFGPIPARTQPTHTKQTKYVVGVIADRDIHNHEFLHVDYGPMYNLNGAGALKGSRSFHRTGF
jgi:hypothetical protein